MSHYILIQGWSGPDYQKATAHLAKIFKMNPERAAEIMQGLNLERTWKFERPVSSVQSEKARELLDRLGFWVELLPVEPVPQHRPERTQTEEPIPETTETYTSRTFERDFVPESPRRFSKSWVVFLILILAYIGYSYWTGERTKQIFYDFSNEVSSSGKLILITKSYERGWPWSKAETLLRVVGLPVNLRITHTISHGPIQFGGLIKGKFHQTFVPAVIESKVFPNTSDGEVPEDFPEITLRTLIFMDGQGVTEIHAAPYQTPSDKMTLVRWEGLQGSLAFSPDMKVQGDLSSFPLFVDFPEGKLNLKQVNAQFEVQESFSGLAVGTTTVDVAGVEFKSPEESGRAEEIHFQASTKESGESLFSSLSLKVDQLAAADKKYENGALELELRYLDVPSFIKIRKLLAEMPRTLNAGTETNIAEQQKQLWQTVGDLIKKSPEIQIVQLHLKSEGGEFLGKGTIRINGKTEISSEDIGMLLAALEADLDVSIPESLLREIVQAQLDMEQAFQMPDFSVPPQAGPPAKKPPPPTADERIAGFLEQEFLVKEGENYKTHLTYRQNQLTINGHTLDSMGN